MLLCVNELFYQNRYAALTIYLEVNSLSERDVQVATHTLLCVCAWQRSVEVVGQYGPCWMPSPDGVLCAEPGL